MVFLECEGFVGERAVDAVCDECGIAAGALENERGGAFFGAFEVSLSELDSGGGDAGFGRIEDALGCPEDVHGGEVDEFGADADIDGAVGAEDGEVGEEDALDVMFFAEAAEEAFGDGGS